MVLGLQRPSANGGVWESGKDIRRGRKQNLGALSERKNSFTYSWLKSFWSLASATSRTASCWAKENPGIWGLSSFGHTRNPLESGPCPGQQWRACRCCPGQTDLPLLLALTPPGAGPTLQSQARVGDSCDSFGGWCVTFQLLPPY